MNNILLALQALSLVAALYPKLAPMIKDIMDSLKGEDVVDITHEELVARVDAAIAGLPPWE